MKDWVCLGCGTVTRAAEEPAKCGHCGDNEHDTGLPVFEGGRTEGGG